MGLRGWAWAMALGSAMSAFGADAITGRVVTGSTALADARVWLEGRPEVFDSTGADGTFSLPLSLTAVRPVPGRSAGAAGTRMEENRLAFFRSGAEDGAGGWFDARGRWLHGRLPDRLAGAEAGRMDGAGLAKAQAGSDTLVVLRMGYEIKKTPLAEASAKDMGDIGLKLRTYRRDTSATVKTGRVVRVYVPSDYKELYKIPVLYLLHGGGANETYWENNCKFLDSLNTFPGRANVQPMIIVTPSAGGNTNYGNYGKTGDPFYNDLTVDIRNWVESHYKADTSRWARAISGLSMGSMQTWNLTLFYPQLWGWSLPMSGGLFKSAGFTPAKLKADAASKVADVAALNQMKLFKVYTNPTDIAYGDTDSTTMLADTLGIRHEKDFTTKTAGGHTDPFWNEVFRKYSPLLFKD